jgi:hypothetical protein
VSDGLATFLTWCVVTLAPLALIAALVLSISR